MRPDCAAPTFPSWHVSCALRTATTRCVPTGLTVLEEARTRPSRRSRCARESQFDLDVVEAFVEYMASEEGELASVGRFSKPFGVPAEARVKSSRTLAPAESVGL